MLTAALGRAEGASPRPGEARVAEPKRALPNDHRSGVILLVRTFADEGVMSRVRDELRLSARRILEIRLDERTERIPLSELGSEQEAAAAVRFDAATARIELWLARPSGNPSELFAVEEERPDDAVLALRITEALRAQGLDLDPDSAAESPSGKATPTVAAAVPDSRAPGAARAAAETQSPSLGAASTATGSNGMGPLDRGGRLWIELAPAVTASPGGLGANWGAWASIRLEPDRAWSLSVFSVVPLTVQKVSGAEGTAYLSTFQLAAAIAAQWPETAAWKLGVGAGAGGSLTTMRGEAGAPYAGTGDSVFTTIPFAHASGHLKLSRRIGLCARVLGGVTVPEVSVKFSDRVVANWGRPFGIVTLGLEMLALRMGETTEAPALEFPDSR